MITSEQETKIPERPTATFASVQMLNYGRETGGGGGERASTHVVSVTRVGNVGAVQLYDRVALVELDVSRRTVSRRRQHKCWNHGVGEAVQRRRRVRQGTALTKAYEKGGKRQKEQEPP